MSDKTLALLNTIYNRFGFDVCRLGQEFLLKRQSINYFKRSKEITEFILQDYLSHLFAHLNINVVLDVGANRGQYAKMLREFGYLDYIISFEPVQELYDLLLKLSQNDEKWSVYPYACGSEDLESEINVMETSEYSSLLLPSEYGLKRDSRIAVKKSQKVKVKRLDSLLPEILEGMDVSSLYLKMDTQGYDLEVFKGLGSFAISHILAMQSEISTKPLYRETPHLYKTLQVYEETGFRLANLFPVAYDSFNCSVVEYDCIMINETKIDG